MRPVARPAFLRPLAECARRSPLLQAGALTAAWLAGDAFVRAAHWPVPGSVLGLFAVWGLLELELLSLAWIERGADRLLDHLMLFFVPAMLALVNHPEFLSLLGLKLLAAVLIGTVTVMGGTALVVEVGFRLTAARHAGNA